MKLGLVTDSLADRSLAEAAAVCRGLGLEQVELGCGNWSPAPHVDLKRLTADAGARHRLLDTPWSSMAGSWCTMWRRSAACGVRWGTTFWG